MHLKVIPTLVFLSCFSYVDAQFQAQYGEQTYIVQWSSNTSQSEKNSYYTNTRSMPLCEMNLDGVEYAWLQIDEFMPIEGFAIADINDFVGFININGGVIGSQPEPVIDGGSLDLLTNLTNTTVTPPTDCIGDFDMLIPMGANTVSLFNLDTGAQSTECDFSILSNNDFCGQITCGKNIISGVNSCDDNNGHGTHGAGIQLSLLNRSLTEFGGSNVIDLFSYKVFDDNGVGQLGAILCALSDIIENPAQRKVVNCSFSYMSEASPSSFDPLKDAFRAMAKNNIFSVLAAGNDSFEIDNKQFIFPLSYFSDSSESAVHSTIGVGAATCESEFAEYSNSSPTEVDISTLGTVLGPDLDGGTVFYEGTSQATFAASAISAMLLSHQSTVDLELLKCALISGSIILSDFINRNVATGILSASMALDLLQNGCQLNDDCPPLQWVSGNITSGVYGSSGILLSDGQAVNSEVIFKAKNSVMLEPGFVADPAIKFTIIIGDCRSE